MGVDIATRMESPRARSLRPTARLKLSSAITGHLRLPGSRVTCACAVHPVLIDSHCPCVRNRHEPWERCVSDFRKIREPAHLSGDVSMSAPCRRSITACIHARLALPWNSDQLSFVDLLFLIDRATNVTLFPRRKIHLFEIFSSYDALWCVSNICWDRADSVGIAAHVFARVARCESVSNCAVSDPSTESKCCEVASLSAGLSGRSESLYTSPRSLSPLLWSAVGLPPPAARRAFYLCRPHHDSRRSTA